MDSGESLDLKESFFQLLGACVHQCPDFLLRFLWSQETEVTLSYKDYFNFIKFQTLLFFDTSLFSMYKDSSKDLQIK